jgi:hypothetical protein
VYRLKGVFQEKVQEKSPGKSPGKKLELIIGVLAKNVMKLMLNLRILLYGLSLRFFFLGSELKKAVFSWLICSLPLNGNMFIVKQ